jgi:hypothetical protein
VRTAVRRWRWAWRRCRWRRVRQARKLGRAYASGLSGGCRGCMSRRVLSRLNGTPGIRMAGAAPQGASGAGQSRRDRRPAGRRNSEMRKVLARDADGLREGA